jgi:rare lipoprotein A
MLRRLTILLLAWLTFPLVRQAVARPAPVPRVQVGLASFYGGGFQGKTTASGERFDKNQLTAAHPRYPGGTVLKVTNLENSRTIRVRVNDRGPARPQRREGVIIDLSRAAAHRLRFHDRGRARVRVEVVKMGRGKQ